jgi:small multidrug resistance family-3 protein
VRDRWGYLIQAGSTRTSLPWAIIEAATLILYDVVAALQSSITFGRVYAAYGGIFIALALA